MGWSCRAEAASVLEAWTRACVASTGSQNTWKVGNRTFFYEASRVEHDDGAVTGRILEVLSTEGDVLHCRVAGSFRIEGDGRMTRAPRFLKAAVPQMLLDWSASCAVED